MHLCPLEADVDEATIVATYEAQAILDAAAMVVSGKTLRETVVEEKRQLIKLLMEIHILPGKEGAKKFDPNRVKITWKN